MKARAQAQQGEPGVGSGDIERAITAIRATGTRLTLDLFQCFLAEAHLRAGDRAHGIAAVEAGLDGIGTSLTRAHEPELWRLKGELLLMPATPRSRRGRRPARTTRRRLAGGRALPPPRGRAGAHRRGQVARAPRQREPRPGVARARPHGRRARDPGAHLRTVRRRFACARPGGGAGAEQQADRRPLSPTVGPPPTFLGTFQALSGLRRRGPAVCAM